jgi:hypothetical protein
MINIQINPEEICDKSKHPLKIHQYKIIPRTGMINGVPVWKCKYCNKKIISM